MSVAIQPIDLQVLFSRLNEIGRDQSTLREAQAQAQMVAASEIAEQSEQLEHRVTQARTDEEGPEQVNDESGKEKRGSGERGTEARDERADDQVFRDPDLGQNVDVCG